VLEEFTNILFAAVLLILPAATAAQTAGEQAFKPVTDADPIEMTMTVPAVLWTYQD
jgi:hypothetical protein